MKIIIASITGFLILLISSKSYSKDNHYVVIKKIENIEVREYKKLIYVSYIPKNTQDRDNSFRNVASYIFGGNEDEKKIAMTSPVVIKMHNKNEMAFIMPKGYTLKNLPKANNKKLSLYEESANIKASITYSGYSNKQKEELYIKELKAKLKKHNIRHKNDFELLVYNSPYQFFNRKNEIVVSINNNENMGKVNENISSIHLGGGCFWCVEAVFEDVIGVQNVKSGYAGGKIKNPAYKEVARGLTEHAEVCEVIYNEQEISLEDILKIFFLTHDPTTVNRQGNDIGKHYRSIILYSSDEDRKRIKNYILEMNRDLFNYKIVTELKKLDTFYIAEEYHQNYYKENSLAPYCKAIISPKMEKARKELSKYYKID